MVRSVVDLDSDRDGVGEERGLTRSHVIILIYNDML
jgi:hypothetical protein